MSESAQSAIEGLRVEPVSSAPVHRRPKTKLAIVPRLPTITASAPDPTPRPVSSSGDGGPIRSGHCAQTTGIRGSGGGAGKTDPEGAKIEETKVMDRVRRFAISMHDAHMTRAEVESELREHPNQIKCADRIIDLVGRGFRYITVHKEIKSGANGLISRLLFKLHTIENNRKPCETIVMSGFSSVDMVRETRDGLYCGTDPSKGGVLVLHNPKLDRALDSELRTGRRPGMTVYIIDEADYGSDEKQKLVRILDGAKSAGDVVVMITATDELLQQRVDMWTEEERRTLATSIKLEVGPDYIGWAGFVRYGVVKNIPAGKTNKELAVYLIEMIGVMPKPCHMLRVAGSSKLRQYVEEGIAKAGNMRTEAIDMMHRDYTKEIMKSSVEKAISEYLETGMKTVYLLKDKYRRAKYFANTFKESLGLLYESCGKVEPAAQGLCARMCGYWLSTFHDMEVKPIFYVNLPRITEYLNAQKARMDRCPLGQYNGSKSTCNRNGKVSMRTEGLGSAGVLGAPAPPERSEAQSSRPEDKGLLLGFRDLAGAQSFSQDAYSTTLMEPRSAPITDFDQHVQWRTVEDSGRGLHTERSAVRVFKLNGGASESLDECAYAVWIALDVPGKMVLDKRTSVPYSQEEHGTRLKQAYEHGCFHYVAPFGNQEAKLDVWVRCNFDLNKVKEIDNGRWL